MNRDEQQQESVECNAQWQWLCASLAATEPVVDLDALAAGVRERLRHRRAARLRRWSVAAAVLLAASGFIVWQLARTPRVNIAESKVDPPMVVRHEAREPQATPVVEQPLVARTPAPLPTAVAHARPGQPWNDDLDRRLAGMQRDIWRAQASARRLPSSADLIRGDLEQFEQKLRRSTL
jgi:hypothetical protein